MGSLFSSVKSSAGDTTKKGETFFEKHKRAFEIGGLALVLSLCAIAAYFVIAQKSRRPRAVEMQTMP